MWKKYYHFKLSSKQCYKHSLDYQQAQNIPVIIYAYVQPSERCMT